MTKDGRAMELRRVFDRSFGEPIAQHPERQIFIEIRVATEIFVIPIAEITSIAVGRAITRLPGAPPTLLGICGIRGAPITVYSLRALLGLPPNGAPRYLVTLAALPIALAFDAYEGHHGVVAEAIVSLGGSDDARRAIRIGDRVVPIIHTRQLVEAPRRSAGRQEG